MKPVTLPSPKAMTKRTFDGDRMVVELAPNRKPVFLDRRMAVTWPSQHNAGYCAIYGLIEEPYTPVCLLFEQTVKDLESLIDKAFIAATKYRCSHIFADISDSYSLVYKKILIRSRKFTADAPRFFDSSEWADMDRAIPAIQELNHNLALVIPKATTIYREYSEIRPGSLRPADAIKPWQRYPAYNALAQCVLSWELFPYAKKKKRRSYGATDPDKEGY